jgi:glucan phosphoethanolaminetransferase (alkaline phosphatase superfamily)
MITITKRLLLAIGLLLAAYLIINFPILTGLARSVAEHKSDVPAKFGIFFGSFGIFVVCLTLVGARIRLILLTMFAVSCLASWTYFRITGDGLSYSQSVWLLEEANQATNVVISYTLDIVIATVLTALSTAMLYFGATTLHQAVTSKLNPDRARLLKLASLLALLVWNSLLIKFIPSSSIHYPIETSPYAFWLASKIIPIPSSAPVPEQNISPSQFDKVVLIIDESIRNDFFQHYQAAEVARFQGINFGEALSFAPCSSPSNAVLRWGYSKIDQVEAQRDPRSNPKIWRYALKAGFKTHFLDAQSTGFLQNYMTKNEREDIQDFQALDHGLESDVLAAKAINQILRTPSKDFVAVVKRGAHFPYEVNYPARREPINKLPQSYGAAIEYAEKDFFKQVLEGVNMEKTLIIYTSDHGERLDGTKTPHCSIVSMQTEYEVPMVVFTQQPEWRTQLIQASQQYQGKISHLQMFSTLLMGMGYAHQRSVDDYFPTLMDNPGTRYVVLSPFRIFPIDRGGKFPITAVQSPDNIGPKDQFGPPK